MNGDNSPAAIAEQQAKVDALDAEFKKYVGKTGQSSDIAAELGRWAIQVKFWWR